MIIKEIKSNKAYFNNDEILDISPDIIYEFKLKKNMQIDNNLYEKIVKASIKNKAFYYIYLKSRTRYELLSKLKLKYFHKKKLIDEVLNYMEENNYINDIDYAVSYILSHKDSRAKTTMKLYQKGIKKEDIEKAFLDIPYEFEENILKDEILKYKRKNIDDIQIILKLTRKGYRYGEINKMLKEMKKDN